MDETRVRAAESFLQEAVYRSRGAQAGAALLAPNERLPDGGRCGLGARTAVVLDLSPRAEELFEEIFPGGVPEQRLEAVRAVMSEWIERQDAFDRRRNHFLKDFRRRNGYDRRAYDERQSAEYRAGLDAINAEVEEERRAAALRLLAAGAPVA